MVDWDGDGDLDVWMTQRTAPRLRFLRNDNHSNAHSLRIRLIADKGNFHGIGSRVELTDDQGNQQIKTLHAGEGYLSQFPQSLHFGLGTSKTAKSLKIRWPDGSVDQYDQGLNKGYWLASKGHSKLNPIQRQSAPIAIKPGKAPEHTNADFKRLIPHSPLKIPSISYMETNGDHAQLKLKGKRQLLIFWATWCGPCIQELNHLNTHKTRLSNNGLEILALNVDNIDEDAHLRSNTIQRMFRRQSWDLPSAMATKETLEIVDAIREVILGRQWTWSIPCSVMLDENGNQIALYEGSPSLERLESDAKNLFQSGPDRNHAVPYPGNWYVAHYPEDRLAMSDVLFEKGMFSLLEQYMGSLEGLTASDQARAAYICRKAGMEAAKSNITLGIQLTQQALNFNPQETETLYALALMHQVSKKYSEAINGYEFILSMEPEHTRAMAALAWLLSVAPDENLRNPERAIRLAKVACNQTQNKVPETLDTLAAAYAAKGEFSLAVEAAEKALSLLPESQQAISPIFHRLNMFRNRHVYILNP